MVVNLQQKLEETSGKLENLDKKLLENYTTLEKKIMENSSCLQKQIGEYSPGSDSDRLRPELSSPVEISKIRMKPPQFDGKSVSWVNYLRQFEAAARANGWSLAEKATALTLALRGDATDILQTLSLEEQDDYHQLVKHLEMRYATIKETNRCRDSGRDKARLVRLAYSSTPENVMERLAVQAFLDGLRDTETRQALTLARPSKLVDALARALEFEAAKQSCRGQAKVRRMEDGVEEGTCNEAEIRRVVEGMLEKRQIRCWNCDQILLEQQQELLRAAGDYDVLQLEIPLPFAVRPMSRLSLETCRLNIEHWGFKLDFKNNVLKINGEEIVLHRKTEETIRVVLAEDTAVPERSEMILDAHLDGNPCVGNIMMFEPRSHDGEVARGIAVGKALLLTEKTVPVRIMNLNHHPVNLRKGIVLGYCSSVSSVIRKLDAQENSVRKITGETTAVNDDWLSEKVLKDQENDPNLKPIVNWKKEDRKPTWEEVSRYSPTVKSYWAQWNSLVLSDGLLKRVLEKSDVHETTGQTPASIVMGRELRLPCDLKFGCTPGDDVAGEDYGASNRMKETYDINANDGRYQPGNQVWLYNPQRRRGLSPKLQSSWEGPYEVVTRINDVVYRIQKLPRGKPRVVHFNRLAPFAGSNDEQAEARVRHVSPPDGELSFEEFILLLTSVLLTVWQRTSECPGGEGLHLPQERWVVDGGGARTERPEVGRVLQITAAEQEKERSVFYLVTKQLSHHKPTYQTVWDTRLFRDVLLSQSISSLAIPKIASGLDGLDWRVIRSMPRRDRSTRRLWTASSTRPPDARMGHSAGIVIRPGDDTIRDEMSLRRGKCYRTLGQSPALRLTPADQSSR
ncbi:hypothetical protein NQ318_009870 [Aromia moschata]|uniref:Integrase p58-like C-terminal domain-containing protein n=1 Tax=Aromia moschata TaxID=1265417 RepID=A0AAV8Y4F5_9CUCU|nr:hypothetical protein NQ318_009870 [Aromia moschata]